MISATEAYNRGFRNGLRPDPDYSVTTWADTHRYLPKVSAKEHGKYRSSRTPFFREIMDCLSATSPIQEICLMKGTQIGGTEVGNNWFGYVVDVAPGPMMVVLPTVELAKDHSKLKLAPTIECTPRLRDRIKDNRSRDSGNTIQTKTFPGGALFLTGSNSAAGFRHRSIRYLFLDDVDGYEPDVDGEGDPIDLAKKRTDTYSSRKKIFKVSTPTVKGLSRIETAFEESDQRYYHVPCPFCGEYQRLEWSGIKFERDEHNNVLAVWYECRHCRKEIDESYKTEMFERGRWVPTFPERKNRGYHLSGLYSPLGWVSWKQIVEEFLVAKGNRERLKVWTNTRLAETFEEAGDQPGWVELKARCEPYQIMTVPLGGHVLTAGVDVQANRLAVLVMAWGRGEEAWVVFWGELYGDPLQLEVWGQLDNLLNHSYQGAGGQEHRIISAAVDSGHVTHSVYNYCRGRIPRVMAIKGAKQANQPIVGRPSKKDVNWMGTTIPNGVQLWPVGGDTAKSVIYGRLKQKETGPGYIHFPIGLDDDFFMQLTAEKLTTQYTRGFPKMVWVKIRNRNEALDCAVYAMAAALRVGLIHMDFDKTGNPPPKKVQHETDKQERGNWQKRGSFKRPGWLDR